MNIFELEKVSRYYQLDKNKKKYVLKNVTLSFPQTGLVSILGKSGSGKSTLLNLIGQIDKPSEGNIYFEGENTRKFNKRRLRIFRSGDIAYIFQHYHLLEKQTALYNVMLPALIKGDTYKEAETKAIELFKSFSINEELYKKKCSNLSGGEKERIAILRAFINKPKVILADEPTGALDKNNSLLVMESLKKISHGALVILVTHNEQLAKQYSDRIIRMKDGKVIKDDRINQLKRALVPTAKTRAGHNKEWLGKIIVSNFIRRLKRNIFSILALTIGISSSMLIFGFSNGAHDSINESALRQFDFGVASISKENRINTNDSPITLIQTMRPNDKDIDKIKTDYDYCHFLYSYDALVTSFPHIFINDKEIDGLTYTPIYSYIDKSIDHHLLKEGKIPAFDTLNQVVINETAYNYLKKTTKQDPFKTLLKIKEEKSFSFPLIEKDKPYVMDFFQYEKLVEIVGVIKEMSFLNTPKIYYSYKALDKYLDEIIANNYSQYNDEMSWKDMVMFAGDNDVISNYSYRVFLKNSQDVYKFEHINDHLDSSFSITSNALAKKETLFSLVDAATVGMEVFLLVALVGTMMIIGIVSFASYSEDIKDTAILLCIGASQDDIVSIYVMENAFLGLLSLLLSFLVAITTYKPINLLIAKLTSLSNIINIPFLYFQNRLFLFPLLVIVIALFVCILATWLPITISKKISLKEELKAND